MKLALISQTLNGYLVGDESIDITRLVSPHEAQGQQDLALILQRKLSHFVTHENVRTAIVSEHIDVPPNTLDAYIVVRHNPRYVLALLTPLFEQPIYREGGIHPTAVIAADVSLGENVSIGPFVVINAHSSIGAHTVILSHVSIATHVSIGSHGLIYPGVRIADHVHIGDRPLIHHNASIGADGFSFYTPHIEELKDPQNYSQQNNPHHIHEIRKIYSLSSVIIGDDVEIGSNTSIDRGTLSPTKIGNNTKIDNNVQIAHNVSLGDSCIICGQSGIAGSVDIGDQVVMAAQAGISDHTSIGKESIIGPGSGVLSSIPPKSSYFGYPATPKPEALENHLNIRRLKMLRQSITELKQRIKTLEESLQKKSQT